MAVLYKNLFVVGGVERATGYVAHAEHSTSLSIITLFTASNFCSLFTFLPFLLPHIYSHHHILYIFAFIVWFSN